MYLAYIIVSTDSMNYTRSPSRKRKMSASMLAVRNAPGVLTTATLRPYVEFMAAVIRIASVATVEDVTSD